MVNTVYCIIFAACYTGAMSKQDTPKSFRFSPQELAELEAAKRKHGSYKAAIMAGLDSLKKRNDLTQDQVLDWIKRNTK
jgi:hypothetical protein